MKAVPIERTQFQIENRLSLIESKIVQEMQTRGEIQAKILQQDQYIKDLQLQVKKQGTDKFNELCSIMNKSLSEQTAKIKEIEKRFENRLQTCENKIMALEKTLESYVMKNESRLDSIKTFGKQLQINLDEKVNQTIEQYNKLMVSIQDSQIYQDNKFADVYQNLSSIKEDFHMVFKELQETFFSKLDVDRIQFNSNINETMANFQNQIRSEVDQSFLQFREQMEDNIEILNNFKQNEKSCLNDFLQMDKEGDSKEDEFETIIT